MNTIALIMAGGLGKRMESEIPKVLHLVNNKPMICHVIDSAISSGINKFIVVVGKYKSLIEETIDQWFTNLDIAYVIQSKPLGTAHCVYCATDLIAKHFGQVVILSGDMPLISSTTIGDLKPNSILVSYKENPYGYGRINIINDEIISIIEEKDCNEIEKQINIVNCGVYSIDSQNLIYGLEQILQNGTNNANCEYYLTDIVEYIEHIIPTYLPFSSINESIGVNTKLELQYVNSLMND